MALTKSLYRALEKEELFLHYQPQISVESGRIIGFEALLRWNQSDLGLVSPGEFIPLAEETGLIQPIGLWVFREACEQYKRIQLGAGEDFKLSVNLSVEQLEDVHIISKLAEIVEEVDIDPCNIIIEITESAAFRIEEEILEKLVQFKERGFLIAIDDFGKEYSSLNRIRSFPVDLIKIDMDFVHSISTGNVKDRAVLKTIIQLAKNLGVQVLAEGVENEEQYDFLKNKGCDELQGFYFYKGLPASELEEILACQQLQKVSSQ